MRYPDQHHVLGKHVHCYSEPFCYPAQDIGKAQALGEIYHQYGNAELQEDILYRTVLREDDGISFYIGDGYTYMPWFEIAVIIDAMIEDGSLAERIDEYNIPEQIDEMRGPTGSDRINPVDDDNYELTDQGLCACVDGFLNLTYKLQDGWQEEMAAEAAKDQPDEYLTYDLFPDIEESI